jgi:hypothetical protein
MEVKIRAHVASTMGCRHHRTRKNITTHFATPKHFVKVKAGKLDKV